jgi:hypothetical protein
MDPGATHVPVVMRMERATGRVVVDGGFRVSWDGSHVWMDASTARPAERLGDEADAIAAEIVSEVLGGLANTTFSPGVETWGPTNFGTRIDLPGDWDDAVAILIRGDGTKPTWITVVDKATSKPVVVAGRELRNVPVSFEWNVRLYPDMAERENVDSRSYVVSSDGWNEEWAGPPFDPPWHHVTTTHTMKLDADRSQGFKWPTAVERPISRRDGLECDVAGQTLSWPLVLRFVVDEQQPSFWYVSDAVRAGCPIGLELDVVHRHRTSGSTTSIVRGELTLRDLTVTPPAVLAQDAFDHTLDGQGPGALWSHRLELPRSFMGDGRTLEMWIDGSVEVECWADGATADEVSFGVHPDSGPVLSWPDCYPELGAAVLENDVGSTDRLSETKSK